MVLGGLAAPVQVAHQQQGPAHDQARRDDGLIDVAPEGRSGSLRELRREVRLA
ncbi:MAG: hypothetical protein QOI40_4060 [Alphaproteobacteria bacterium]|jgi:hypothetical protein|nr:hypothetical protein [Alphaproteobacteria bacterium]